MQYLWEVQDFSTELVSTDGDIITVQYKGDWNFASGPDFMNASIRIGSSVWAGQVEIHIKASDWFAHNHHLDPAYANVILHVVLDNDVPAKDIFGRKVPCVVIPKSYVDTIYNSYLSWLGNKDVLPCDGLISFTPTELLQSWLKDLLGQRIKLKQDGAFALFLSTQGDILQTEILAVAITLGQPLNEHPFEMLARNIPWMNVFRREWTWSLFKDWTLYLSGLSDACDPHLRNLWRLDRVQKSDWRYGSMRPNAFPKVRVIQWAWFLYQRFILKNISSISSVYMKDELWSSDELKVNPGKSTLNTWAINLAVYEQLLLQVGKLNSAQLKERWRVLEPDVNKRVNYFVEQGVEVSSALSSQAIIQLEKEYCRKKKCVNCAIGRFHFNRAEYDRQIKR